MAFHVCGQMWRCGLSVRMTTSRLPLTAGQEEEEVPLPESVQTDSPDARVTRSSFSEQFNIKGEDAGGAV